MTKNRPGRRLLRQRGSRALLAILLTSAACSSPGEAFSKDSPPLGLGPRAVTPAGHEFRLEIARTPAQRAMGYMYRSRVGREEGMLFIFEQSGFHSIWMKNCLVGLDVVWLSDDLKVVHLKEEVPPCKADPCPGYPPMIKARYILEIASGMVKRTRLRMGDAVKIVGVDLERSASAP